MPPRRRNAPRRRPKRDDEDEEPSDGGHTPAYAHPYAPVEEPEPQLDTESEIMKNQVRTRRMSAGRGATPRPMGAGRSTDAPDGEAERRPSAETRGVGKPRRPPSATSWASSSPRRPLAPAPSPPNSPPTNQRRHARSTLVSTATRTRRTMRTTSTWVRANAAARPPAAAIAARECRALATAGRAARHVQTKPSWRERRPCLHTRATQQTNEPCLRAV